MIRRFALINGDGNRFEMNNERGVSMHSPEFGFKSNTSYGSFTRVRRTLSDTLDLGVFKAKIAILGYIDEHGKHYTAYTMRAELFRFMSVTPLRIEYSNDNGTFLKDVKLAEYPYDDQNDFNDVFNQDVSFDELTPWYRFITNESMQALNVGVYGKTYYVSNPTGNNQGYYTYAYVYNRSGMQIDDHTIMYEEVSKTLLYDKSAGEIILSIRPTQNQVVIQNTIAGVVQQTDAYNIPNQYLGKDYLLIVNTFEEARNATLSNPYGEISAYQFQDPSRSNWVQFKAGFVNKLTISGGTIDSWMVREVHDDV